MPEPVTPSWVDEFMPPIGPCGLCGGPDARHRVIEVMVERVRAGDSVASVAEDYGYAEAVVRRLMEEETGDEG